MDLNGIFFKLIFCNSLVLPWGSDIKREVIAAAAVLNTFDDVWGVIFVCVVELLLFDFGCERSKRWFEFKWFNTSATL